MTRHTIKDFILSITVSPQIEFPGIFSESRDELTMILSSTMIAKLTRWSVLGVAIEKTLVRRE